MKFPAQEIYNLIHEVEDSKRFQVEEWGEWEGSRDNDLRQERTVVIEFKGKYYAVDETRWGYSAAGYQYDWPLGNMEIELPEVVPVTKTVKEWQRMLI